MKFNIYPTYTDEWYFELYADNGKVICTSHYFQDIVECKKSIKLVKKCQNAEVKVYKI